MSSSSGLSKENVYIPVTDILAGTNLSTSTVQIAFTAIGDEPESGDWKTAAWYTDSTRSPHRYYAYTLVSGTGNGGTIAKDAGTYDVWLKISDLGSEILVEKAAARHTIT